MPAPRDIPDEWDFYPCRVDDAPASIFVNLWYAAHPTPAGADTLYWARIAMVSAGDHGMGDDAEADRSYPLLDELTERAQGLGFYYVGRLRNHGTWQLLFYAGSARTADLDTLCRELTATHGREIQRGDKPDAAWSYYRDFLMPDAEARRWMLDRQVVDALVRHGDPLTEPRRVDHWIYFATPAGRDACVAALREDGFEVESLIDDADYRGMAHGAQVHRVDSVVLGDIHAAVMLVHDLAAQHGGHYDGWETSVQTAEGSS